MISTHEALILSLLSGKVKGAYGSELIHESGGKLKRGSVYALLYRLEDAGLVKSTEEPPTAEYSMARVRYRITGEGAKARREFGVWTGLIPQGAV
jgi:DNA-binding PadR family transcriptional regulator